MKSILAFLNLILCLELIFSPLTPHLKFISTPLAMATQECPAGMNWDNSLNRCLVNDSTAATMNQMAECEGLTGDERAACHRRIAEDEKTKAENSGDMEEQANLDSGWDWTNRIVSPLAVAIPLTIAFRGMAKINNTCAQVSFIALIAGAAALFVGDNLANLLHGQRLDEIEENWNKIVKGDPNEQNADQQRLNASETQKEAFEQLAKQEDSLASAAKMKSYFFGAATLAFATSAGFAIYEAMRPDQGLCAVDKPKGDEAADAAEAGAKGGAAEAGAKGGATEGAQGGQTPDSKTTVEHTKINADGSIEHTKVEHTVNSGAGSGVTGGAEAGGVAGGAEAGGSAGGATGGDGGVSAGDIPPNTNTGFLQTPNLPVIFPQHDESTDWQSEVMKARHFANAQTAQDLPSFYILSQAHGQKFASPSIEEYESIKEYADVHMQVESKEFLDYLKKISQVVWANLNPVPEAHALGKYATIALSQLGGIVVATAILSLASKKIGMWLASAPGRITVGTILAVWSGIMLGHTIMQTKRSRDRAAFLRDLKKKFEDASGSLGFCKPEDREDPQKPDCYCYTADNQRNPNRGNSQICQGLWYGSNFQGGDYYSSGDGPKGCIDKNRQHDPKCACRKSSKGCLKATPNGLGGMNMGSFKMLAGGLAPLDQIGNGTFNGAKVSPGDLNNQALRMMKANQKLLKDKRLRGLAKAVEKGRKQFAKEMRSLASGVQMAPAPSSPPPTNPAQAVAALEKELKQRSDERQALKAEGVAAAAAGPARPEFGMTEEDLELQQGQVAEAMKQELDYGQNDISSGENIFKVLSNRYQKSGLRRLFDDEGKTKAEKPAESEIRGEK